MTDEVLRRAIAWLEVLVSAGALSEETRAHLASMPPRMRGLLASGRREKLMRWLGFMQGSLWALGVCDLDTLKKMHMPVGATFDSGRDSTSMVEPVDAAITRDKTPGAEPRGAAVLDRAFAWLDAEIEVAREAEGDGGASTVLLRYVRHHIGCRAGGRQ